MARLNFHAVRKGVTLMETAVVILVVLLVTFGAIEYGWMFTKSGELLNAAQQAARLGIRPDATSSEVEAAVLELMTRAHMEDSGYTVTITPADVTTLDPGEYLTVEIVVPYSNISITGFSLLPLPTNLTGETTMSKEGP